MGDHSIKQKDLEWWTDKVERRGVDCFNPSIGKWAAHTLRVFVSLDVASIECENLDVLAERLGIPQKYLTRAIATLTRCGIVYASLHPTPVLVLHRAVFPKRKASAQVARTAISKKARQKIINRDGGVCAHCLEHFPDNKLHIDHIVPLSLLGADEPGNMVSMCKSCNGKKSDKFHPTYIKRYRSDVVNDSIGVRFKNGFFWPYINGTLRENTRREI